MAHVDDYPGCPCSDCCRVRFQCWRVAVESGRAVMWADGQWMMATDDFDDEWEDDRAA